MKTTKKKTIIKTSALVIIIIAIFLVILSFSNSSKLSSGVANDYATGGSGRGSTTGTRITYNFNYGWTFSKGTGTLDSLSSNTVTDPCLVDGKITYIPNPESLTDQTNIDAPFSPSYDPTNYSSCMNNTWKEVSLPHTYNDEDTFNNYMETEQNGERSMYAGTAWYKKEFNLDASYQTGKKIIIEFEAARQAAKVWVNGNLLEGTYQNGFIAFGYEIPQEYLKFGEGASNKNIITVMTDNTYPYYYETIDGVKTASRVSWHDSHWQPNYGGLYRNSYLYVVDDLHLTIPLYSFTEGVGTYVYTTHEAFHSTSINIDAEVENSSLQTKTFYYRAIIKDALGNVVKTINGPNTGVTLEAGEKQVYNMSDVLTSYEVDGATVELKYWSTKYPYLYTCEVEIYDENNNIIDNNLNTFGIRTFRITTDSGFYLNEHSLELDGWGQKSTWEWAAVGAAYPDWMSEYGIKLMKDAGANYLRFGHTAGSNTQIGLADKYGILVTQPGVDGEGTSQGGTYNGDTYALRMEAMRDMIINLRNHPSIIMWEMGNQASGLESSLNSNFQTRVGSWLGDGLTTYSANNYAEVLYDIINKYDYGNRNSLETNSGTWHNTETASNRLITLRRPTNTIVPYIDVAETTEGLYGIDNMPQIEGEYTRLEIKRGMWDKLTTGFSDFSQTSLAGSEYTNATGETVAIAQIDDKKKIMQYTSNVGGANWIFSDSISHGRVTSEASRTTGEVDATMIPKTTYYVNQVINSDTEPAIYIIGHWNYASSITKDIYVVAKNVNRVALYIDGTLVSQITKEEDNQLDYLYTFPSITYPNTPSTYIEAKAYDNANNQVASYRINKHGAPDHLSLTATTGPNGIYANGSDILMLDVELLDSEGNLCTSYDGEVDNKLVTFTADLTDNGNITGEFLGGHNSSVPALTRTNNLYLEAGKTRVFVRTSKNAGNISVTASMDGVTSDTYQTTSLVEANTNGLTLTPNRTANYVLTPLLYEGLGIGAKINDTIRILNAMLYIENLSYNGTFHAGNGIDDAFGIGTKIYSDAGETITYLPYKFLNAELIRVPDNDRDLNKEDLLGFEVNRDVTVYIARDPSLPRPDWLTSSWTRSVDPITNENDVIISSAGVNYEVWKKDFTVNIVNNEVVNATVDIGSTTSDGAAAITGVNQFVFVKETEKVTNRTFFAQDFNYFTESNIINGFGGYNPSTIKSECDAISGVWDTLTLTCSTPNLTTITRATMAGRTGLRFTDNLSTSIAYVTKGFSTLNEPFTFSFKAYVTNTKKNQWLRTFLSNGKPIDMTTMSNIPVEVYLFRGDNNSSNIHLKYKQIDGSTSSQYSMSNVFVNTWYTYRYYVDPINKKFTIKIYDEAGTTLVEEIPQFDFSQSVSSLNYMTFSTGKAASYTTDYYIDDISIQEEMDIGATSITLDGNVINLDTTVTDYIILNSTNPSESVTSMVTTEDYYNHTVQTNDITGTATYNIENKNGEHFIFTVTYERNNALEGWHVEPTETNPDNAVTAVSEIKDNINSIHLNDTSATKSAYIYKSITPVTSAMSASFDFYLTNDVNYTQDLLNIFLANGAMVDSEGLSDISDYSKLGVRTHLIASNSNEYFMSTYKINSSDSNTIDDTIITKGEWHHIEYYVNVYADTYTVYLDNVEILSSASFYNNQNIIDHIYIGTGTTSTGDFYISNFEVTEESGYPIDGVSINQTSLSNFDNTTDTYYFYTDEVLTSDTEIVLATTPFYVEEGSSITKDIANQTITIVAMDNFNRSHTWTIHYDFLVNRPISVAELQALIDEAMEFEEGNYTPNTWAILQNKIATANNVITNALDMIPKDFSLAYYELDNAMNNMLYLLIYDGYQTATVNTISYSNNLKENNVDLFSFENVLDNDKPVYFGDSAPTWTSVPYKYLNSEYIVLTNRTYKNGIIILEPLQRIDILVFKDRDAGPLAEPGFVDTGEIATSSTGVVYKIYSKTYADAGSTTFDNISIEFNDLVNNEVTDNANIVAFINHDKADNVQFVNENFNIYNSDLFSRAWQEEATTGINFPNLNTFVGEVNGTDNYINITSNSVQGKVNTYGFSMVYREMAKLYEQLVFKFAFNVSTLTPPAPPPTSGYTNPANSMNRFNRAWLRQGPGDIGATGTETNGTNTLDKANGLIDFYVTNNSGNIALSANSTSGSLTIGQGKTTVGVWTDVEIRMNILTKEFQVIYKGTTYPSATTYYSMNNGLQYGNNSAITYADYVYFSSRLQGPTDMKYKDIMVYPVDSNVYSDIKVAGTSIGNYKDLTKAYLYKTENKAIYNSYNSTNAAAPVEGVLVTGDDAGDDGLDNDSFAINPTITTTTLENDKLTTISDNYVSESKGTFAREYKVYYEVDSDTATEEGTYGKKDLVIKLKEAMDLNPSYYDADSFDVVETAISNAILVLSDHSAEIGAISSTNVSEVTGAYKALDSAIIALTQHDDVNFYYQGKITTGKNYGTFDTSSVHITNKSSLTANFNSVTRISGEYAYQNDSHIKYLVTDTPFYPGTTITMALFEPSLEFYYYIVTQNDYDNDKTEYLLSDFTLMNGSKTYDAQATITNNIINVNRSFIVDFENATDVPTGTHTLTTKLYIDDGTNPLKLVSTSDILTYNIYNETNQVSMDITANQEVYSSNESVIQDAQITVSPIVVDGINVTNTQLEDRVFASKISVYEANYDSVNREYVIGNRISFPKGTSITDNDSVFYLSSDGYIRTSRKNQVSNLNKTYTFVPGYYGFTPNHYFIKTELIATYDYFNDANSNNDLVLATTTQLFEITEVPNCSISSHVTEDSYEQVFVEGEPFTLTALINTACNNVTSERVITLSLLKKTLAGWSDFGYTLLNYQDYVNNSITTLYDPENVNLYKLITYPYEFTNRVEESYTYQANFNSSLPKGLYKLQFDIRSGSIIQTDFITFLIK